MRKLGLAGGAVVLLVLLAFTWSFAQMDIGKGCKKVIKVMGDEMMHQEALGHHCGETMHQMGCGSTGAGMMHQGGCCGMGSGMMHQMGCGQMCCGMGMCAGMTGCGQMCCGMGMCGGMMGCRQQDFFICCEKELELTDEQVEELKSIKMNFMRGSIEAEASLKIAQLELKSVMHDEKASVKDIEAKLKSVAKIRTDMKLSCIKSCRNAKALLTPEQLDKLKKMCEKM
ncbi:MAG: hypothetical protein GTO24_17850 [candidate division Zixibacteria bacterium]|nr:hypothetical protein [candidate division Zixibacteria bacterium]